MVHSEVPGNFSPTAEGEADTMKGTSRQTQVAVRRLKCQGTVETLSARDVRSISDLDSRYKASGIDQDVSC